MIKISVQSSGPEEVLGVDAAYRLIKECGFDAVDANVDHFMEYGDIVKKKRSPIYDAPEKELMEQFKVYGDAAKKYGLENYQAHAPFPSYIYDPDSSEQNDYMIEVIKKTIRGCDAMDCRNLIVHPFFFGYEQQMDPETEWNVNIEQYSKLIPVAKEYGVTICLENMFATFRGKRFEACCSNIETACRYIDTLNDIAGETRFGFCLDTGHLLLLGKDIKNAMVQLGDRIVAFHVHDNDGVGDQHLAPYMGIQDWNRFVEGLKAIGFNKTMSFETYNIWNKVDHEMAPSMMRFIAETGRMFAKRASE